MTGLEDLLHRLLREFERLHTRYALIGGFALGALGAPRATRDLDFLWTRVKEFFDLFQRQDQYKELEARFRA